MGYMFFGEAGGSNVGSTAKLNQLIAARPLAHLESVVISLPYVNSTLVVGVDFVLAKHVVSRAAVFISISLGTVISFVCSNKRKMQYVVSCKIFIKMRITLPIFR